MITQFTVGDFHKERGMYTINYFSKAINENSWITVPSEFSIVDIFKAIIINELLYSDLDADVNI